MIPMNKKGVTIVELLAVVVIMGMVAAIVSQIIIIFMNASDKTLENARANTQGMLIVETIEKEIEQFESTNLQFCSTVYPCIILEKHYTDQLVIDHIETTYYTPPQTLTLSLNSGIASIDLNQQISDIEITNFVLDESSSIKVYDSLGNEVNQNSQIISGSSYRIEITFVIKREDTSTQTYTYCATSVVYVLIRTNP